MKLLILAILFNNFLPQRMEWRVNEKHSTFLNDQQYQIFKMKKFKTGVQLLPDLSEVN